MTQTTKATADRRVLLVVDQDDLELLAVLIENELGSNPEDYATMPGALEAELEARAGFHPRLTDLLATMREATTHATVTRFRSRSGGPSVFDQDASAVGGHQ